MLEINFGAMKQKILLAGALFFMLASVILPTANAHNIDVKKFWSEENLDKARTILVCYTESRKSLDVDWTGSKKGYRSRLLYESAFDRESNGYLIWTPNYDAKRNIDQELIVSD